MKYEITVSEAQAKALECIAYDPEEWITNWVTSRANQSIEQIYRKEIDRMIEAGITISGSKEDIVVASVGGTTKTVKQLKEQSDAFLIEEGKRLSGN